LPARPIPNLFTEEELRAMDTTIASTQLRPHAGRAGPATAQARAQQTETQGAIAEQREQQEGERRAHRRRPSLPRPAAHRRDALPGKRWAWSIRSSCSTRRTITATGRAVPLVEDKALLQQQRRFREDFDRQFSKQLNQSEEKKIPVR
jgi:hypothetical protein